MLSLSDFIDFLLSQRGNNFKKISRPLSADASTFGTPPSLGNFQRTSFASSSLRQRRFRVRSNTAESLPEEEDETGEEPSTPMPAKNASITSPKVIDVTSGDNIASKFPNSSQYEEDVFSMDVTASGAS